MKCEIYIRVSTGRDEQKTSLTYQRELFKRYVKEKGWEIYEFYEDVSSGTKSKRKNLQRLIADAEGKKFDIIFAKELSRLARNGALSYKIRDIAQENKIHIITLDNAINTLEGNTDKFGLFAWLYEDESQRTSSRLKCTFNTMAKKGLFKGCHAPYGYDVRNKKLYISDDGSKDIVIRIYRDYMSGKGFDRIARELYEENIPIPAQRVGKSNATDKWHGSSVRKTLENPHYLGYLVLCRTETAGVTINNRNLNSKDKYIITRNSHESIISKADFETVQEMIKSRRRIRPKQGTHLFSNILFCADCGHSMHHKPNRKGEEQISQEDYKLYISEIDIKLEEMIIKKQECIALVSKKLDISLLAELNKFKENIMDIKELTPEILNRFVERIEIMNDGTPKIFYRFSGSSIFLIFFEQHTALHMA